MRTGIELIAEERKRQTKLTEYLQIRSGKMRGQEIKATLKHDAGAYARCSYCGRYSDIPGTIQNNLKCDCGRNDGWSGSFQPPTAVSRWLTPKTMVLYRADGGSASNGNHYIRIFGYDVTEETNCGYWISSGWNAKKWKWVSKTSRRRFAYPTKEEAVESFFLRQQHRIGWGLYHQKEGNAFSAICLKEYPFLAEKYKHLKEEDYHEQD